MNKEQYNLLKKCFLGLKATHKKARIEQIYDFKSLNYYCNIIEGFQNIKDYNLICEHILKEIGGF